MICKSIRDCFIVDLRLREPDISVWKSIKKCFVEGRVLALVLMRLSQWMAHQKAIWRLAPLFQRMNEVLTGFECHLKATIGEGLFIAHTQNTVIGEGVVLGGNVTLYNGVTLGAGARGRSNSSTRYPIVKDGVVIYTGAKVLGPIIIGEYSTIGANAVVLKNVPAEMIAVGVPAKIIAPKK